MPSSTAPLYLSSFELLRMLETADDATEVEELLLNHPLLMPRFIHFQSLYRTILRLEENIKRTKEEMQDIYQDMERHNLDDALRHFVTRKRQERYAPYQRRRTPTTPSTSNSAPQPPSSRRSRQVPIRSPPPRSPSPIYDALDPTPPVTEYATALERAI